MEDRIFKAGEFVGLIQKEKLKILSTTGAPLSEVPLDFEPMYYEGNENYIILANQTRITLIDTFFLLSDNKKLLENID